MIFSFDARPACAGGYLSFSHFSNFSRALQARYCPLLRVRPAAALADCTAVYPRAFSYNSALVSATIPHNVKEIGESAFSNCRNLASVTIENGVESIGNLAFLDTNLLEVTIPSSVTTIGNCVFGKNSQMVMVHCMFPSRPEGWHSNWFGGYSSGSSDVPYEWIG